ncbi:MAG: AraC family transcriptional regulator [Dyadobacter sp. 50-39]|uniref:helix-turn-helix domain-containing protein n=1 Tax=Dyadobacter sp. 50-39 TaxID=1895756 RepID=UPI00095B5EB2|nr:helix-turn-helix domain-containing protein [Dyadobacter sp. 50-39]OJV20485.1 MAG: AraC family transcriptional regulator [Dyadobacter sp. 50-39]
MNNTAYNGCQAGFHAERLGDGSRTGFRQSELFELIWIKKGHGAFTVDMENRPVGDNCLFCIFPGQINRFNEKEEFEGYKIAFSREFLCAGSSLSHLPQALDYTRPGTELEILNLGKEIQTEVETIVEMMVWEYTHRPQLWTQMLHGLLKVLLAYLPAQPDSEAASCLTAADHLVFNRFRNLLDRKFTAQRQVSAYASDLAVSSNYLSEIVKRVSGHSAAHHIQQRVLLEAKRKAVSTSFSMKKIALDLGFDDPSTFSKFFKTMAGSSFSDFRSGWFHLKLYK